MTVRVPTYALRDRVTLERSAGESGAHGDVYGDPEPNVRAHIEGRRRLIASPSGSTAFADATGYFRPEVGAIAVGSRIEWPTGSEAWYRVVHAAAVPDETRPVYREVIMERIGG